ncbi:MAG: tyrosine--tRNA ligase [Candidatus Magasanikbacteria bacterium RIFCSPHIGHO2_02_FULL_50_9b]|uniref:Tyrosine--tRNA ligase n=1 Tax=Candidatus Magasanikbacteria bacterium RIFCSPHIGHO2_02_FULL_50_9b TaxID=1798682 RepID=A0A1F6M8S4_9BACT|nr:MAG: tyrosine--tRNA ligase [Candidatus Magasanikbacteria bacterium RIFCSPHIGHO2_02_FULL_50_9b]
MAKPHTAKISTDPAKISQILDRGVAECIVREDLEAKLKAGAPLRIKLGIDPTSPNLHLGRSIPLLKLRDFQELGHQVVFIVGDFTGIIGDTSDKEAERPMLTEADIAANLKTYVAQAGKIIDLDRAEIHFNSTWLGKLGFKEIGEMANHFSVAEFIARENIAKRLDGGKRVSLREVLYPLMQAYDSVAITADVELGGTDQRFNVLAGRSLQPFYGQPAQNIIVNPLIAGLDGRKMSSSWGNTINLLDEPADMYGKVMSLLDELVLEYFMNATRIDLAEIVEMRSALAAGTNPRDLKMRLGREIVGMYWGAAAAGAAEEHFRTVHQQGGVPEDMPVVKVDWVQAALVDVLVEVGFCSSKSEARRQIEEGGVKVDGVVVEDVAAMVEAKKEGVVVQKGKRFFVRIV